jgi:hypothetical protein
VAPVLPCGPVAPVFPWGPVEPVDPVGPTGPVEPVEPVCPGTPVAPDEIKKYCNRNNIFSNCQMLYIFKFLCFLYYY